MSCYRPSRRILDLSKRPWGFLSEFSVLATLPDAWFDCSDVETVLVSGNEVTELRDKSGNNRHAVQSSSSRRHLKVGDEIVFDGVDDHLDMTASSANIVRQVAGFSCIFVCYHIDNPNFFRASTPTVGHIRWNSSPYNIGIRRLDTDVFKSFALGFPGITNEYVMTSVVTDYPNQWIYAGRNGTFQYVTDDFNGGNFTSDTDSAGVWLGALGSNPTSLPWSGRLCEMLLFRRALEPAYRIFLEGYLAHKWQLVQLLPAGHKYKNRNPLED